MGVQKLFIIESELGRFTCRLSIHTVIGKMTNKRIKTAGYRKIICEYAISNSFRKLCKTFNDSYHRTDTDQELFYGTIAGDIEQEGQLLIDAKRQSTREILARHGFDPDTGLYPGEELPEEYQNQVCEMIELNIDQLMIDVTPGWKNETEHLTPETTTDNEVKGLVGDLIPEGFQQEEAPKGERSEKGKDKSQVKHSEPDREEMHLKPHRRRKRVEVAPEKKESSCSKFIKWFNSVAKREEYGITKTWLIEKDSAEVVYIMIDVVYVTRQVKNRVKYIDEGEGKENASINSKEAENSKESGSSKKAEKNKEAENNPIDEDEEHKRIGHLNIRVETNNKHYLITSLDKDEAFKELVAVVLKNKLYKKYFIFFIDGEQDIADNIDKYFAKWKRAVKLDWMHLEHKCFDRLSNALVSRREPDPRGEKEYYKQKSKQDQIKRQDMIAKSRLYARAIIRILWTGNVEMAKAYLDNLDPNEVSKPGEIARLKKYFSNKQDWITCYALRKKAGLRNASNGVEGQNNTTVAIRQKHNGTSWRPSGSGALSSLSTLYSNGEEINWFYKGIIDFTIM